MRTIQTSFSGGEVSPEMQGRFDTRQYLSGASEILNFTPLPQGPVTRRPGSRFVANQYNLSEATLIPFVYSTDQALVIEMRRGMFRFFTDGQQLLYATPKNMGESGWDLTANTATFLEEHGFTGGEEIQFTVDDGNDLPTGLSRQTPVFVIVVDNYTIQVEATASSGTAISLGGSPTGYVRAVLESEQPDLWVGSASYVQGDLMYWVGLSDLDIGVYYCKEDHTADASDPYVDELKWWPLLGDGQLTVPTPYDEEDVPTFHYAQSNDVVTLVHPDYRPRELRRLGATRWDLRTIAFGSTLTVPTDLAVTEDRGSSLEMAVATATGDGTRFEFATHHALSAGDAVYVEVTTSSGGLTADGYYLVNTTNNLDWVTLKTIEGALVAGGGGAYPTPSVTVYYASLSAENTQSYKVTAVDANNVETVGSSATPAANNIDVEGASNAITWTAVTGAERYRIYREQNGLYGYIGESETEAYTDAEGDVDLGRTPPLADESLDGDGSGTDYPRAVGYHQQRRVFGGTTGNPRSVWMTKSGTESDMTYSLPVQDNDRISFTIPAREAVTVRHFVPMRGLVTITQQSEWLVDGGDSRVITPGTVGTESLSEVGASDRVRPMVVGSVIVYAADRGGHIYTLGYSLNEQAMVPDDLSLRATHLFDGLTIQDSTYTKSPYPVLWFVSSSGKLLSLTYIPRQEVAGWAVHDLGEGACVESVCSIPEGDQDSVYLVVRRTVDGTEARYIERLVPQVTESLTDSVYLDSSVTYDGLETAGRTLTLTGGSLWKAGEAVTVTASSHLFRAADVGDEIELHDSGVKYRATVSAYTSSTVVTAVLRGDVPIALHRTAVTTWAFARAGISSLTHLEGETVSVVADGVVLEDQTVEGGAITLPTAAVKTHVGRNYTSRLKTLPAAMQIEGLGQGRTKNISKVHLRVLDSSTLTAGPTADKQVPVEGMPADELITDELRAVPDGSWTADGSIVIQQSQPKPATILGMTMQVELGD